ncbi:hypothetical protein [Aquimarina sp. 2201CG14-23]|uniref:hypothetical protein n=1 Tax=Aquimarina mycalae TaxID=3040073 RepID=UPI002477F315|nr:hypothetical protein [Aquimarina sp. 2201CG14-23]MDH7445858.1 hypothetical protein [Aquimarina sp. 2201CG14-23]
MKKVIILLLLIIGSVSCKNDTEEINFKVGFLPNSIYTQVQNQIVENTINYVASKDIIESLKKNGVSNPDTSKSNIVLKSIVRTGSTFRNSFPIHIEFLESNHSVLKKDSKFYGKSEGGVTKIDSIISDKMTTDTKEMVRATMETMLNQIKYPERKIKIGESFENRTPMKMPVYLPIKIEVESIYTLEKIENGIGYFNLYHRIRSKTKDYRKSLVGRGKGTMKYDIEKNFFTKLYSEMEINVQAELEGFGVKLSIKSIADQNTEILKKE